MMRYTVLEFSEFSHGPQALMYAVEAVAKSVNMELANIVVQV